METLKVEQCDREAAASQFAYGELSAARILSGREDHTTLVQAFARHRIAERERNAGKCLEIRAANAASLERKGAAWEAYDRATLDCHAAIREQSNGA